MEAGTARRGAATSDLLATAAELRGFLLAHPSVEVWEGGRRLARLAGERSGYALNSEAGRLVWHFWSADANAVRRVVGSHPVGAGRLRLGCLRLGQRQATPVVLVAGAGAADEAGRRQEFRQAVLAAAERDWRGWHVAPAPHRPGDGRGGVQRLLFRRQQGLLPCVAVDEGESGGVTQAALAHALVWAEQVRQRWPRDVVSAVRLVLPVGAERTVAQRRTWLRPQPPIECYYLDRSAGRLEPAPGEGSGNQAPSLCRAPGAADSLSPAVAALLRQVRELCPQARWEPGPDGGGRVRYYGLEIVRAGSGAEALAAPFYFGCGREQSPLLASTQDLFLQFLREVARQRVPGGDRRSPYFGLQPEGWMEHLLRSDPASVDPWVDARHIYGQVASGSASEQDRLDLLAVDREGRLWVWELKAEEDLGFPLQALDYWWRVRHHQQAGDFERLGYFPGVSLSPLPPRIGLVAPALRWHPHTELLGRWIAPDVPCLRIGVNEQWRHGIQVVYRKELSHG